MYLFYKNKMCGTFQGMYKNRIFTNFGILQQKWKVLYYIIISSMKYKIFCSQSYAKQNSVFQIDNIGDIIFMTTAMIFHNINEYSETVVGICLTNWTNSFSD